ncbi:hypothetical protein J6590_094232, partial [Homalodisca vitripennis]
MGGFELRTSSKVTTLTSPEDSASLESLLDQKQNTSLKQLEYVDDVLLEEDESTKFLGLLHLDRGQGVNRADPSSINMIRPVKRRSPPGGITSKRKDRIIDGWKDGSEISWEGGVTFETREFFGNVVCNERLVRNLAASESRVLKKFGPYVLVAQRNCHSSWRKIYELSSWKKPTTKAVIASFPFMGSDRIFLKSCRCPSVCAITLDKR